MKLSDFLSVIDPETLVNVLDRTRVLDFGVKSIDQLYFAVPAADITVSELAVKAAVYDIAFGYDELNSAEAPESALIEGITGEGSSTDTSEPAHDKSVGNAFDGNPDTFWATVPGGTLADAYLIADLGEEYTINQVDYTKRFDAGALYNCTGNLLDYVIEVSTDGEVWQKVAEGDTIDGTTEIAFEPVAARYVRLTATRSYHWQDSSANTVMCVAEMAVHKYIEPIDPNDPWGKSKWTKVAVDSETIYSATEGNFEYAWDDDLNTIWHSNWQGAHDVLTGENTISGTIDFNKVWKINQFSFTNRQDATDFPAYTTQASLYVKENESDEWTCVGEHVAFEATKDKKTFHFDEMNVRFVKFVAEKSSTMDRTNGAGQTQGWVCISEFDIGYEKNAEHVHNFGEWTVTTAPTCTEKGVETRKCSCGETETREVAALGHTEEIIPIIPGKAATCTETGLTEGKKCSVCDTVLVAQEEIPALGHDFINGECDRCDEVLTSVFEDVHAGDYYFDPVEWAVENKITDGATDTTFDPAGELKRAQFVTFLWRAAGCPKPETTVNPFNDVKEGDFFYDAVLWAVENEITDGISDNEFGAYQITNRAQAVTFLWRYLDKPEATATNSFDDVVDGEWYEAAINWAVGANVTDGVNDTQFGIALDCIRGQAVTFLYRAVADK